MRKVILMLVGLVLSAGIYSQVPLVGYKPVIMPDRSSGSSNNESVRQPLSYSLQPQETTLDNYTTVAAYYYNSDTQSYKRTKVKINPVKDYYGGLDVYVRGILNNLGHSSTWHSCNNEARKVFAEFDGDFLANNFEWKALGTGMIGTIYFNY